MFFQARGDFVTWDSPHVKGFPSHDFLDAFIKVINVFGCPLDLAIMLSAWRKVGRCIRIDMQLLPQVGAASCGMLIIALAGHHDSCIHN